MSQIKNILQANFADHRNQLRGIGLGIIVFLIIIGLLTSFYTIPAESQGIVLRFGKYKETVDPGLRFKLPFGIDERIVVQVRRQLKQEFGFGTPGASNPGQYSSTYSWDQEKNMVTGDLNAASVTWVVQYRINDPFQYLFKVKNPSDTLRAVSESVMREVVGDRTVDEVITIGRQDIEVVVLQRLQELVNKYEMGLSIDQVQLKDVNPPDPVRASFNEVNQAQQEKVKLVNEADREYNKVVPLARGEAKQKIEAAKGYALKRINEAEGDATRFNALFTEYQKAPEVTRRRMHLETMKAVVPTMGKKIIMDADANQLLPLLQINPQEK
ncbi:MAG: FtsH protease activity modulator HflK [Verrucomicrobiota bacterium]|nr:FtsH protease activity modulator HflK [Verrucomicrobiota bacterium]